MDKKPMDEKVDPTRRPPLPGEAREPGLAQAEPQARKAQPEIPAPAEAPAPQEEGAPRAKPRRSFVGFLIGLIILGGLGYYGYRVFAPAPAPRTHGQGSGSAPQSVGVATVGTGDIKIIYGGLGTVTPLATITVRTQINGILVDVPFKEGQYVKKGDLLAQIDDRPYKLLKEQDEGQLAHDQGLLQQAQTDLVRYQTLVAQNSIARQQAEDQVYIVKQYQGSVRTDQAQIDTQTLNIAYCHITAPVTGRMGLRLVDPGNYVQTSDTTGIAVVTQLQPISVIFSLPEDDIPDVMAQMKGATPLTATVYDRANVHELGTGTVTVLDNQIDTTTGMVKFRAEFPNTDESLFPNQFVNVQVLVRTLKNVITAPVPAIQRGAPGTFVYLVNADNTASVRKVTLGSSEGNMVQIVSGLKPGDRVVTDGTDRLTDGAKVFVPGAESAASPSGAAAQHHHNHQRNPE
ncbi:MAG: efflux RND transporter periplasmic adaptor subunit [Methylovirgula sp.]|nr:efflux RND transporter periplasmic adaptor subunit [Methylovirgula sp.]